jgi:hypothetical protein
VGGLAATVVALGGNFLGVTSALLGRPLLPTHTLAPPWVSAADGSGAATAATLRLVGPRVALASHSSNASSHEVRCH